MVGKEEDDSNGGQASTAAAAAAKHEKKKETACSSSSENIDEEDDFFQIEGPILGTHFSLDSDASRPPGTDHECPDPKRIPSSVFARSTSATPTDWSVTSNESLFSINVGNASFSKDHLFLYGKPGEMGNPNDPLAPLPPPPTSAAGESSAQAKPAAASSMENTGRSDSTAMNFAFPILAGDERSSECSKDNHGEFSRQSTAQLSQPVKPEKEEVTPAPQPAMESPKVEEAPAPAAAEQPPPPSPQPSPPAKWFPCCSCCPFCC